MKPTAPGVKPIAARPSDEYLAGERRAVLAFAMDVLADSAASPGDRATAHARLIGDAKRADFTKLSTRELRTFCELLRRVRGDEPRDPVEMPLEPARCIAEARGAQPADEPEPREVTTVRAHAFTGSSNVQSATLTDDGRLTVTFTSGASYRYADVTPADFDAWCKAPSAGSWFAKVIKPTHRQLS